MLTRGILRHGWHHGRWAWVGNRSCSRNCIFQQIFTITFWYCCVTHSHRFHLAYLPAVRVGSLTPWPVQCLRKNLFRTGESTKNYRDILTSLSSEAMQILGSVAVSWKSFGKWPLLLEFQILDFGRKRALRPPPFFAFLKHLEWGGPSRNGPIMSGIKFWWFSFF